MNLLALVAAGPARATAGTASSVASVASVPVADAPAPAFDTETPRRLWYVQDHDGQAWSVSTTPAATYPEMTRRWPTALVIEPDYEEDYPLEN